MVTINPHTTRASGTILTATIYNADHNNHITNAQNLNSAKLEGATPPVVDGDGVVWSGTSGALLRTVGGAPVLVSRNVSTGTGLLGGGNLSADRTLTPDFSDQATAEAGSSAVKIMSPLRVAQQTDFRLASQVEAEANTDNTKLITALRAYQQNTNRIASQVEAETGTDAVKLMSPLRTAQAIAMLGSLNIGASLAALSTTGTDAGVLASRGGVFLCYVTATGSNLQLSLDGGSTYVTIQTGSTITGSACIIFAKGNASAAIRFIPSGTVGTNFQFVSDVVRNAHTGPSGNIFLKLNAGTAWSFIRVM